MLYYFFFSSRRRHTRYIGVWSSDVCSSDLVAGHAGAIARARAQLPHAELPLSQRDAKLVLAREYGRSEERRVGKECRFRWWKECWNSWPADSCGDHAVDDRSGRGCAWDS